MDIDAIEKRSGNLGDVALDHGRSALASTRGIAEETARTRIHGGEHEARRESDGDGGAKSCASRWKPSDLVTTSQLVELAVNF